MNIPFNRPNPREIIQAGYRYALSLCHHHYDAEDLVQQSWIKCCEKYTSVRNKATLFTVIRHLYYDRLRRNKIISFEPIEDDAPWPDSNTENALSDNLDLEVLLANLKSEEREVIYLNCVEGYTAREIGSMINRPRNSVLSILHRAKKKLSRISRDSREVEQL